MSDEYAEDFETLVSEIAEVGQFPTISGVTVTHLYSFSNNLTWMNTLAISPRIHEVKNRAMTGEPYQPGSFSSVFIGNAADLPYRVSFSQGLWLPEVSLTVPLGQASIEMSASISDTFSPVLKADLAQRMRRCALTASLVAQSLAHGMAEIAGALRLGAIRLGAFLSYRTVDSETTARFAWDWKSRNGYAIGLYGAVTSDGVSGVASVQRSIGTTNVACGLHLVPRVVGSECFIGMSREFSMSNISAAISTSGTVKSCFVRHLDKNMRVTFTAQSNVLSETHSFGIGLTLQ